MQRSDRKLLMGVRKDLLQKLSALNSLLEVETRLTKKRKKAAQATFADGLPLLNGLPLLKKVRRKKTLDTKEPAA